MRVSKILLGVLACVSMAPPAAAQSIEDVGRTAGNIVTRPLKDANVVQEQIPPLLQAAAENPYSLEGLKNCRQFAAEIARLDEVLGPDVDQATARSGQSAGEFALNGIESVAAGLIPGRSIIRRVTGAEARENEARAAVYAGGLRRAYLKGTARAKGCKV